MKRPFICPAFMPHVICYFILDINPSRCYPYLIDILLFHVFPSWQSQALLSLIYHLFLIQFYLILLPSLPLIHFQHYFLLSISKNILSYLFPTLIPLIHFQHNSLLSTSNLIPSYPFPTLFPHPFPTSLPLIHFPHYCLLSSISIIASYPFSTLLPLIYFQHHCLLCIFKIISSYPFSTLLLNHSHRYSRLNIFNSIPVSVFNRPEARRRYV